MTFYAYVHARPEATDHSAIFYVGKGRKTRFKALPARNRYHAFVLDKHGAENILTGTMECSSDEIAFELEVGLIKCLRRAGVQLTNMTDGGDGTSGHLVTEEGLQRRSTQMTALWTDPEFRARQVETISQRGKALWSDPEHRVKMSTVLTGIPKTMSAAALEARRKNLVKAKSAEGVAKHAAISKDQWSDPIRKQKQAEGLRKAWLDPVKRQSMLSNRPSQKGKSRKQQGIQIEVTQANTTTRKE